MTKNDGMQVGGGGFDLLSRLGHGDSLHKEARAEIERLKRYSLIVESYLDRETLKEVLTKYRATPDGRTLEPREPLHAAGCPCPDCLNGTTRSNIPQLPEKKSGVSK